MPFENFTRPNLTKLSHEAIVKNVKTTCTKYGLKNGIQHPTVNNSSNCKKNLTSKMNKEHKQRIGKLSPLQPSFQLRINRKIGRASCRERV